MNVKIVNGEIVITLPMTAPSPSSSGKTMLVASTRGGVKTEAKLPTGEQLHLNASVYYKKADVGGGAEEEAGETPAPAKPQQAARKPAPAKA